MYRLIWNQKDAHLVPNQSVHGKYNLIWVDLTNLGEKSFQNRVNLTKSLIVITLFQLISNRTEFRLVLNLSEMSNYIPNFGLDLTSFEAELIFCMLEKKNDKSQRRHNHNLAIVNLVNVHISTSILT